MLDKLSSIFLNKFLPGMSFQFLGLLSLTVYKYYIFIYALNDSDQNTVFVYLRKKVGYKTYLYAFK
jgi:hypothetical protein